MTNYIVSVQKFSITIAASGTSNTATINSVNTSNSVILWDGFQTSETTATYQVFLPRAALTNSTTVTATRNTSSSNTVTVSGTVIEFDPSVIASIQTGTVTIALSAATGTATITAVNTSNAALFYLGCTTSGTTTNSVNVIPGLVLTNSTTVTANRNASSASQTVTVGYAVVEFVAGVVNSVQPRAVTLANTNGSDTDTITSVTTGNTILLYNGQITGGTSYNIFYYTLQLTNGTTVTLTRGGSSSSSRTIYYTALEFVAGVLNSSVQRGTIALTGVASNTATITAISGAYGLVNWAGYSSSLSTNNPAQAYATATLTNTTTITANKNTTTSNSVVSYEAIEFTPPAAGGNNYYFVGPFF